MMSEIDDYFQRGLPISARARTSIARTCDKLSDAMGSNPGVARRATYRTLMGLTKGMRADEAAVVYVTMLTQMVELLVEKGGPNDGA